MTTLARCGVVLLLALAAMTSSSSLAQQVAAAKGGGLSVSPKKCGQRTCQPDTYCSQFESMCRPCADICETKSHNFHESTCNQECQDYIHDQRYMRKGETGFAGIKNDVDKLYVMVIVCFILLGTILASLIGAFLFWYLRCRTDKIFFFNFKKKESSQNNKSAEDGLKMGFKSEGLKLKMPGAATVPSISASVSPSLDPVTPATTSTPLSRNKHPSEDTTLNYAYDNRGMMPSPVLDQQQQQQQQGKMESSF